MPLRSNSTRPMMVLALWAALAAPPPAAAGGEEPAAEVASGSKRAQTDPPAEVRSGRLVARTHLQSVPADKSATTNGKDALQKLLRAGATIDRNAQGEAVSVSLRNKSISDADLAPLAALRALEELDLSICRRITSAGLAHVKGLENLKSLNLKYCTSLSDDGLKHVKGLKNLERLELYRVPVTDAGLENLKSLGRLKHLDLKYCSGVTDAGMEHLKGLETLEHLNLYKTAVGDNGLKHLSGLKRLKSLDLSHCPVTDKGLAHLKDLKSLEYLKLSSTVVTDRGLGHLHGLKNLKSLYLLGTRVSPAGVAAIRRALPGASVTLPVQARSVRRRSAKIKTVEVLVKAELTNRQKLAVFERLKQAAGLSEPDFFTIAETGGGVLFELGPLDGASDLEAKLKEDGRPLKVVESGKDDGRITIVVTDLSRLTDTEGE